MQSYSSLRGACCLHLLYRSPVSLGGRWFRAVLFESGSLFLPLSSDPGGLGPVLLEGCVCLYRTVGNLSLSKDMAGFSLSTDTWMKSYYFVKLTTPTCCQPRVSSDDPAWLSTCCLGLQLFLKHPNGSDGFLSNFFHKSHHRFDFLVKTTFFDNGKQYAGRLLSIRNFSDRFTRLVTTMECHTSLGP